MSVQLPTRPSSSPDPEPTGTGYTVLVLESAADSGQVIGSFRSLAPAMELAGVQWYEANGNRPYDVWVRCEATGHLHFAPRLRIRLEHGARDAETLRLAGLLERAPLP
jgi:hypothetical protein